MKKEEFCFKIKAGKIISIPFKKNFTEDVHDKLETKKSQKFINRNTIENFVPRLKPIKTNRIPSPLELCNNKKINENNDVNIKLKKEILSEKENSSFQEDSDICSSSSEEDTIYKNEKEELEDDFSTSDRSPDKDENNVGECENYLINDEDVNYQCNKSKNDKCIKNMRTKTCNIKNLINVNTIQKSYHNNININNNNKKYMNALEDKDNENLNSRIKKTSILDVLINIRGN